VRVLINANLNDLTRWRRDVRLRVP